MINESRPSKLKNVKHLMDTWDFCLMEWSDWHNMLQSKKKRFNSYTSCDILNE